MFIVKSCAVTAELPCIIIGAGDFTGFRPDYDIFSNENIAGKGFPQKTVFPDYIIAADGGYNHLLKIGVKPDLIVGDLDSISEIPAGGLPDNIEVIRFPKEKNETDTELAVNEAIKRGFNRFYIYGAFGGRTDHILANIALTVKTSRMGYKTVLIGETEALTALINGKIIFNQSQSAGNGFPGIISIFAYGGNAEGVTIKGLKYPLENFLLEYDSPIGLSNEFTSEKSDNSDNSEISVEVKKGILIITHIQKQGC